MCFLYNIKDQIVHHLLLTYPFLAVVWNLCYKWMGLNLVQHYDPRSHLEKHAAGC